MSKTRIHLSVEQLATLFTQLQRLESAGLSAFRMFAFLAETEALLKKPLARMLQQLRAGLTISEAGFNAGIFDDTLKTLIHAAECSGRLVEVYGQLAKHYTELSKRMKIVKSRLYVPVLMLTLSLFLQPLPALIASKISELDFLQLSLGRLVFIVLGVFLLLRLPEILQGLGIETAWHRLQLRIPSVAEWLIKRQINEFFFILALQLESGLAFAEALPKAVVSIKNSCLREQFNPALSMLPTGASVTDTLAEVPVISPTLVQIVSSSEQSGKLASGILHYTQLEAENISLQNDTLAEWLPRLIYSLIALWMAYSILGSQFTRGLEP